MNTGTAMVQVFSMGVMLFIGAFIFIAVFAIYRAIKVSSSGPTRIRRRGLGLQPHLPLEPVAARLEAAFEAEFGERLKARFLENGMSKSRYEVLLTELKRYFVLAAMFEEVPMFSEAVDELWHEMLTFEDEYARFCEAFAGRTIHHQPHETPRPMPDERAWFDWVYSQLFVMHESSVRAWGRFFASPLPERLLAKFRRKDVPQLTEFGFHEGFLKAVPEARETALLVVDRLWRQVQAVQADEWNPSRPVAAGVTGLTGVAGAFVFYSMVDHLAFDGNMGELLKQKMADPAWMNGNSSDAGLLASLSSCASNSTCSSNDGGGSSCSSGSGSSCSSSSSSSCSSGSSCGSSSS